jgi:uncharacterized membrane protein YbhN (UPF0104 family)
MQARSMIWQSVMFALLGAALLYFSFDKIDFNALIEVFKTGSYSVVIPVFFVSLIVYVSRVKRWQILYKAAGYNAPVNFLLASLASGYLVNFAVPRLGEVSRALILKRWLNYPVPMSLSTIVFERISDVICLCIIIVMAFVLEIINEGHLLQEFSSGIQFPGLNKILLLLVLAVVGVLIYFFIKSRKNILGAWFNQFTEAFKKLIKMENRTWFLIHTGVIWLGFFLMTYLWFFLFKESRSLTIYQAYLIMVLGVIARTLPIQAGSAGAYHFIVSKAIVLLGVGNLVANALAIVIHGFQTVFTLLFGAISYLWLISKKRDNSR